jgi:predicted transcriptional regulator
VLRPNVTDLAKALRVSRQAIYDWQAGRPMAADNIERLRDIARAADLFDEKGSK